MKRVRSINFKKVSVYFSVLLLVFQLLPGHVIAESITDTNDQENKVVLFAEEVDGLIELYEDRDRVNILHLIKDDTIVELVEVTEEDEELDEDEEFSFVRYVFEADDQDIVEEDLEGYIHNEHIISIEDAEQYRVERLASDAEEDEVESTDLEEADKLEGDTSQSINLENQEELKDTEEDIEESEEELMVNTLSLEQSGPLIGLALKQPVSVYTDTNRDSEVLKSYNYGHVLKYRPYSDDWYLATVYINGTPHTGYIHTSDVGEAGNVSSVSGVALKQPTSVYSDTTKSSIALKSYQQGHILKYKAYDKDWFIATVYVNGKAQIGYIHVNDVETATIAATTLQGVGIKNPTNVYARASTESQKLKSYNYGHILKYRTFSSDWYEATVYINGKTQTGYINKKDVGSMNVALTGYGQLSPTIVYSDTSKNSTQLKSYAIGASLKYRPYNKDWYQATVMYNGKWETGYIHTKDVGVNPPVLSGYAHATPTHVYSNMSRSSTSLKSYARGSILKYRVYNKDWFSATIMHNGKWTTGYIHAKDVGKSAPVLTGYAVANPTTVYAKTSKSSNKLKSYNKGSKLSYRPYNTNWYVATVYINGKAQTGYIHKNDVGDATAISIVNPRKTYTYNQMTSDIKVLAEAYPDLISYKVVGKSEYGRDLYAVSLGNGKPTTFINGSLHAREWITTSLNMNMIEEYAKAYKQNKNIDGFNARNILNNTTIWFMPMVNPDGVTLQQQGLNAFPKKDHAALIRMNAGSKNFKRWKANAKGVDLNRNFSVDWKTVSGNVNQPHHLNHKGSSPASASETKAVINFVKEINPQMTINYHSSGEVLYWGYNQKGANRVRDNNYAREIGRMTGYTLMPYGGYPSGGGFLQYFTETYKRPSITPELSPHVGNTNVPVSTFTRIWNQNRAVGLYAARESAKLYNQ